MSICPSDFLSYSLSPICLTVYYFLISLSPLSALAGRETVTDLETFFRRTKKTFNQKKLLLKASTEKQQLRFEFILDSSTPTSLVLRKQDKTKWN